MNSTIEMTQTASVVDCEQKRPARPVVRVDRLFEQKGEPMEQAVYFAKVSQDEMFGALEQILAIR